MYPGLRGNDYAAYLSISLHVSHNNLYLRNGKAQSMGRIGKTEKEIT